MITIRKKERSDGTFSVYLDIVFNGKRKKETLKGFTLTGNTINDRQTMQAAEAIAAKRTMQMAMAEYDFTYVYAKEEEFLPFFLEHGERRGMNKRHNVQKIINAISPGLRFKDINLAWAERFIAYMRKPVIKERGKQPRPYSEATIYSCIGSVKTILNIAVQKGIINRNPLVGLEIKRIKVQKEFLTIEDIDRLYNTECEYPEVKRAFLFACFSGLRLGDVLALRYSDIQGGEIRIIQRKTKGQVTIPITNTIRKILEDVEVLNANGLVFDLPSKTTSNAALKRWVVAAGITKKISFHSSRHTFATLLVYYSKDIFTASRLLGHSDVKITQIYAKLIDDAKLTAMNSLPELQKKG